MFVENRNLHVLLAASQNGRQEMGRDMSKKSVTSVPMSRTQTSAHGYARSVNRTKHGASCALKHGAMFMR